MAVFSSVVVPSQQTFRSLRRHAAKQKQDSTILQLQLELASAKSEIAGWWQWWHAYFDSPTVPAAQLSSCERVDVVLTELIGTDAENLQPRASPEEDVVDKVAGCCEWRAGGASSSCEWLACGEIPQRNGLPEEDAVGDVASCCEWRAGGADDVSKDESDQGSDSGLEVDAKEIDTMVRRARKLGCSCEEVANAENFNDISLEQKQELLLRLLPQIRNCSE